MNTVLDMCIKINYYINIYCRFPPSACRRVPITHLYWWALHTRSPRAIPDASPTGLGSHRERKRHIFYDYHHCDPSVTIIIIYYHSSSYELLFITASRYHKVLLCFTPLRENNIIVIIFIIIIIIIIVIVIIIIIIINLVILLLLNRIF
jgi:hypothetical protein